MSRLAKSFLVGLLAGAFALTISYALRILVRGTFLPETASEALFSIVPGQVESSAVESLGPLAKYSAFSGAIIINLVLYGFIATLLYRYSRIFSGKGYFSQLAVFSLLALSVMAVLTMLFLGASQFALLPVVLLYLLPPNVSFGVILLVLQSRVIPAPSIQCQALDSAKISYSRKRRLVIKSGIAAGVAGTILLYGLNILFSGMNRNRLSPTVATLYSQEVTQNEKFYRVDINIFTPDVNSQQWKLSISGLINNKFTLTYDDLLSMPAVEQYNTLECVSNEIGGDLVSTARWRGVRLKDILGRAGVQSGASYIVFRCSDGYDVGIPLERGLLDGTVLAYEMNGVPLPKEHGHPLRVLVPGLYGMMNAKWVTEIELVNNVYDGYWQRQGWTNKANYQTTSEVVIPGVSGVNDRFDVASASSVMLGNVPIAGIAFSGDRGIERVEVSTDGGATWTQASVKDPLSNYTWVLWSADWNPPSSGNYKIAVRATDKTGAVQTAQVTSPYPNGATGYHIVDIRVVN